MCKKYICINFESLYLDDIFVNGNIYNIRQYSSEIYYVEIENYPPYFLTDYMLKKYFISLHEHRKIKIDKLLKNSL